MFDAERLYGLPSPVLVVAEGALILGRGVRPAVWTASGATTPTLSAKLS